MAGLSIERAVIPDDPNVRLSAFVTYCNETIASAPDARRAMSSILDFIVQATHADGAAIALPEGGALVISASTSASLYVPGERIAGAGIAVRAFSERKTYLANSTIDPRTDATRAYGRMGTTVVAPIMQGRRAYGVLLVKYPATHGTHAKEAAAVSEFASVCGTVLGSAIYLEEKVDPRSIDHATGLANRRAYDRDLSAQIELYRRFGVPVTVALFRVEERDTSAVERAGTALQSALRTTDAAFRIADKIFAVLLKNCSEKQGQAALERIQRALPAGIVSSLASPRPRESARSFRSRSEHELLHAQNDPAPEPPRSIWDKFNSQVA